MPKNTGKKKVKVHTYDPTASFGTSSAFSTSTASLVRSNLEFEAAALKFESDGRLAVSKTTVTADPSLISSSFGEDSDSETSSSDEGSKNAVDVPWGSVLSEYSLDREYLDHITSQTSPDQTQVDNMPESADNDKAKSQKPTGVSTHETFCMTVGMLSNLSIGTQLG